MELKSKVINGRKYDVGMLPATSGWALYLELLKMLGPALGAAAQNGGLKMPKGGGLASLLNADLDVGRMLGAAVAELGRNLNTPGVMDITAKMASVSFIDGKPLGPMFDAYFGGKYAELSQWLLFALGVNFGDFFDWSSLERLGSEYLARPAAEASASPSTFTGPSGGSSSAGSPVSRN